jgi:hypothetical protein
MRVLCKRVTLKKVGFLMAIAILGALFIIGVNHFSSLIAKGVSSLLSSPPTQ